MRTTLPLCFVLVVAAFVAVVAVAAAAPGAMASERVTVLHSTCLTDGNCSDCETGSDLGELLKQAIDKHRVFVAAKSYCPYCKRLMALFDANNVPYTVVQLDQVKNGAAIQAELKALTGQRTVPNVFVGAKHIGGFDDTSAAFRSGTLGALFKEAGVDV